MNVNLVVKSIGAMSILVLSALAAASADRPTEAPKQPESLKIEFWHSMAGAKGVLLADLVKKFNASAVGVGPDHRRVEVHSQFVGGYDEGLNKLRTAVLAGSEPHLVQITDIGAKVMIDSQRITPLSDLIADDPDFPLTQILPSIRRYYELGGKLQALPFATSNPVLYYNLDAFSQRAIAHAPQTFAQLEEDARLLSDEDKHICGITWPLHSWFFEEFVAKQGAVLFDHDNSRSANASKSHYLSPEAVRFVTLWNKMVQAKTFCNVGRGWDPAEQNFLAGRAAMLITSSSDVFELSQIAPFRLAVAPLPGPGGTVIGGNALWMMKNKRLIEKLAAFEFVKFMASPEAQESWHTHTGYFPIRQDVINKLRLEGFYKRFPAAAVALEQMQNSPSTPATWGALVGVYPEAREHIMTAIEEVLSGRNTIEAALQKAEAKTDFSLNRYNRGLSDAQ